MTARGTFSRQPSCSAGIIRHLSFDALARWRQVLLVISGNLEGGIKHLSPARGGVKDQVFLFQMLVRTPSRFFRLATALRYLQHTSPRLLPNPVCGGRVSGTKQGKQTRLEWIIDILERHPWGLAQCEIARQIQVERSSVHRGLNMLETHAVFLHEDEHGRISLFR